MATPDKGEANANAYADVKAKGIAFMAVASVPETNLAKLCFYLKFYSVYFIHVHPNVLHYFILCLIFQWM